MEKRLLEVTLDDGKYTVIMEADGRLHALRYGEAWRDLCGDKLVYSLANEIEMFQKYKELYKAVDKFLASKVYGSFFLSEDLIEKFNEIKNGN